MRALSASPRLQGPLLACCQALSEAAGGWGNSQGLLLGNEVRQFEVPTPPHLPPYPKGLTLPSSGQLPPVLYPHLGGEAEEKPDCFLPLVDGGTHIHPLSCQCLMDSLLLRALSVCCPSACLSLSNTILISLESVSVPCLLLSLPVSLSLSPFCRSLCHGSLCLSVSLTLDLFLLFALSVSVAGGSFLLVSGSCNPAPSLGFSVSLSLCEG